MIRFKDRFRDHCKARYNKIPGCGVSWIGNSDLERFDCCDRGGRDRWWLRFFAGGSFAECVFCGIANFAGSEACRKGKRAIPLRHRQGRPRAQKASGAPKSSQNQLKRKKNTEPTGAHKSSKVSGSTQKLKKTSGAPKRPQNKKKN